MPQLTPEYIYVEKPTIDQLKSLLWQHIEGSWNDPQVTERENFKQVLITGRLRAAIKGINLDDRGNPWLDDTQVNAVVSRLERLGAQRLIEANQTSTELLLKGTTVLGQEAFVEAQRELVQQLESRAVILRSLDPEALESLDAETRFLAQALPHLETIRRLEFAAIISSDKNDDPSWKKWTDKSQQESNIEKFKQPLELDSLAILIVKSMLLTGFDAPLEQVLYLDRGMKEYELLPAIARVNRVYDDTKKYGLVVDPGAS